MGSWQDCPVGFSHWTFPLKEACCPIMKLVSKLCLVSINYKSWSRLTRGGDESNRLWAIILSYVHPLILLSSHPSLGSVLSSLQFQQIPWPSSTSGLQKRVPHSHLNLVRWSAADDNQVICHGCHWVTTQSPIGTQSSAARPPIWNCPGSIWNS